MDLTKPDPDFCLNLTPPSTPPLTPSTPNLFSISSSHSLTQNPKLSSVIHMKPINDTTGECQLQQQANGSDYKWGGGSRRYLKP